MHRVKAKRLIEKKRLLRKINIKICVKFTLNLIFLLSLSIFTEQFNCIRLTHFN